MWLLWLLQGLTNEFDLSVCTLLGDETKMFERGSEDTFRVEVPDVGKLRTFGIKLVSQTHTHARALLTLHTHTHTRVQTHTEAH